MGNELVKFSFSQKGFQVKEKVKAFLIRNTRKCIIWILSLQIGDQLGEFMVTPKCSTESERAFQPMMAEK